MPSLLPSGKRYVWGGGIELAPTDLDRDRTRQELTRSREELLRSEAQLQELAHRLISAQDDERRRIAGELHDDFSQRIAALIFELHQLERHRPLTPESLHEAVAPLKKGLETLSDDIHHLAYSLHPMLLQHVGLDSAIQDHIARVSDRTGLRIVFQSDGPAGPIPLDQSTCVFRIVQESLHNIVKYAHATEVHVSLKVSSHGLGLSVTDNGIGFDPHRVREGLGLRSMKERLHALYGAFQLVSRPGQGTRVCAWIPAPIPNEPPST
jgi:signal transduction histidine kinase